MRMMDKVLLTVNVICSLLILWRAYAIFRGFKPSKRMIAKQEKKAEKRALKAVAKK